MPALEKDFWQPLKNRGLSVLAIAREHDIKEIEPFKSKLKLTMPVGVDPDRSIYSQYAARGIPRTFVISKAGKVVFATAGFRSSEFVKMKVLIEKELLPPSLLQLASDDLSAAKYDPAIARLKSILQTYPENAQAHYLLAVAYAKTKQFSEADAEYRLVIKFAQDRKLQDLANLGLAKLHPSEN